MNILFFGNIPYPCGMAGTKRIQHAILALKKYQGLSIKVIILRQSSQDNKTSGLWRNIPYHTIMPDLFRLKAVLMLPVLWLKTINVLKKSFYKNKKNILYKYNQPSIDDLIPLIYGKFIGYKIIFDIVEDDETAKNISSSIFHILRSLMDRKLTKLLLSYADGIIVISTHLENKYRILFNNRMPFLKMPVTINQKQYLNYEKKDNDAIKLFYSGSYGIKDGVENLIRAFEQLATEYKQLKLILTGKGEPIRTKLILGIIKASPFNNRIEYKGYLSESEYYKILNTIDIPCMTRVDLDYAQAGFPFKLGEYLSTGQPVIASKVSDINKFLRDRHNAILVSPSSVDDLVEAVRYILENPEKASKIGNRGKIIAQNNFDYQIVGKSLHSFLNQVLEN